MHSTTLYTSSAYVDVKSNNVVNGGIQWAAAAQRDQ